MSRAERKLDRQLRWLLIISCLVWAVGVSAVIFAGSLSDHVLHAIIQMNFGVILLWVLVCGVLMVTLRPVVSRWIQSLPGHWQVKFVLLAIAMAMLEEAITTAMTNLAPLFGAAPGEAYITASGNYWDVVMFHSVVAFVPMFIAWSFLLKYRRFPVFTACLLFGITGLLGETLAMGPHIVFNGGFWLLVYGLMLYLPVATIPEMPERKYPEWWSYLVAIFAPILAAVPVTLLMPLIHPDTIHFPPLGSGIDIKR